MNFEDLDVWKRARALSVEIYRITRDLRDFAFRDQITRSGLSVPSNIAEGFERETLADSVRFLSYAKGSCGELRTQLLIGVDAGYLDRESTESLIIESREISRMLGGLMQRRKSFVSDTDEAPGAWT